MKSGLGIHRPLVVLFLLFGASGKSLNAQTDASTAAEAVATMPLISSAELSKSAAYGTVANSKSLFRYDQLEAVSASSGRLPNLPGRDLPETKIEEATGKNEGLVISYSVPTNQMYLELLPSGKDYARIWLHGTTNEVYELMSKVALSEPAWHPEQVLHATTNQHWIYTVVPVLDRTNTLYFWARDWTEIDDNHNGIPDWWEWENFGSLEMDVSKDYDGDGVSVKDEYLAHIEPNKIRFRLSVENFEVNHRNVEISIQVTNGHPQSMAVLVDSTNYANAVWQPMNPSLVVDLGPVEGQHEVRVGLRGRATTSRQTWKWDRFWLNTAPPVLSVTSPTNQGTPGKFLQIEGTSSEPLSRLSYDVANAEGLTTNHVAFALSTRDAADPVVEHYAFGCVDVPLATGTNLISIHATDQAGNASTTKLSCLSDPIFASNPPVIVLRWPKTGTRIGTDQFGCRGFLDDPNVTIKATFIEPNGLTNEINGVVEREGSFWVNNVPLHEGTNFVGLTASNAAGRSTTTNLVLVKSELKLELDAFAPGATAVSGTIGRSGYTVWVNGTKASMPEPGKWVATNMQTIGSDSGTTATVQVRAIPEADRDVHQTPVNINPVSTNAVDIETSSVVAMGHFVTSFYSKEHLEYLKLELSKSVETLVASDDETSWKDGFGGKRNLKQWYVNAGITNIQLTEYAWKPSRWPQTIPSGSVRTWSSQTDRWQTNTLPGPPPFDRNNMVHCDIDYVTGDGLKRIRRIVQYQTSLCTGGQAIAGTSSLFSLKTSIVSMRDEEFPEQSKQPVSPEKAQVGTFGSPGTDGILWVVLPNGMR